MGQLFKEMLENEMFEENVAVTILEIKLLKIEVMVLVNLLIE